MLPIKTILYPTDFSAFAQGALPLACALARDYSAMLIFLHVRQIPAVVYGEFGTVPPVLPESIETVTEKLRQLAPSEFTGRVEFHVRDGDADSEILNLAEQCHADLIVMGTHGRTGLNRLLMGSVAEAVSRKASCPVLTLKQPMARS